MGRGFVLLIFAILIIGMQNCKQSIKAPLLTEPFYDNFERIELGNDWYDTTTNRNYRIVNGELVVSYAHNHPLWLRKRLPQKFTVEFDAWSNSHEGDIKFELCGDGVSFATQPSYVATGYVLIFGGWRNSRSIIAKRDEHGAEMAVRKEPKVIIGQKYHFVIRVNRGIIQWYIDNVLFLEYRDLEPICGKEGQEFFAFNNWETELHFDNLKIIPERD